MYIVIYKNVVKKRYAVLISLKLACSLIAKNYKRKHESYRGEPNGGTGVISDEKGDPRCEVWVNAVRYFGKTNGAGNTGDVIGRQISAARGKISPSV